MEEDFDMDEDEDEFEKNLEIMDLDD